MRISDWSSDVFSSDLSPRRRRLRADLLVAEAFLDQAVVGEDVERGLEGRPRDLHMRSPAAEPLVGGDAVGKHLFVDSGKEGLLGARDLGGRRLVQVGPGLAIGRSEEHTSEIQSLMRITYADFCLRKTKSN